MTSTDNNNNSSTVFLRRRHAPQELQGHQDQEQEQYLTHRQRQLQPQQLKRRRRHISISTAMLIMIFLTVVTKSFFASWIIRQLVDVHYHAAGIIPNRNYHGTYDNGSDGRITTQSSTGKILHVVTTRFQQLQPHLVDLGKARLELFETFCLPTMVNQQDLQNRFLWFVMTDPDLDPILMQRLEQLLRPFENFYLVMSNEKLITPTQIEKLNNQTIHQYIKTGDMDLLFHELFDVHRPVLIETRLDADDGLNSRTLSEIQRVVLEDLPENINGWQIICSRIHYEWRNNDITGPIGRNMSSGKIRLVREQICVTPGYTLVRHRPPGSIDFPTWPRNGHNLIVLEWPECSNDPRNETSYNCWKKLGTFPSAIRSRTITSAGMSRIAPPSNLDKYDNQTRLFWDLVERDFGIFESKAISTSEYLQRNLPYIVEDNLKGQWYVCL